MSFLIVQITQALHVADRKPSNLTIEQLVDSETQSLFHLSQELQKQDEHAIDALFASHDCEHVYLDVGTNIGIQIRKLYEPQKFEGAPALKYFEEWFGPAPHCHVCAIGFEPNPRHKAYLEDMEHKLTAAGAGVLVFKDAAGTMDSSESFNMGFYKGDDLYNVEPNVAANVMMGNSDVKPDQQSLVRAIDLGRIIRYVDRKLKDRNHGNRKSSRIVMKMDIEAVEFEVLPHLMLDETLCMVNYGFLEVHTHTFYREWQKRWGQGLSGLFYNQTVTNTEDCPGRTKIFDVDDETSCCGPGAKKPWPTGSVCK